MTHLHAFSAVLASALALMLPIAPGHSPAAAETAADAGACGVPREAMVPPGADRPEAIAQSLYAIVSGPAGAAKDWTRLRALHAPGARIGVSRHTPEQGFRVDSKSIEEFIALNERLFADRGFFETEVARKVERIGHVAHAWSTFESREAPDQPAYSRGVNSIQLISDGRRWCVLSVTWDYQQQNGSMLHPEGGDSNIWPAA